MPRPMSVGEPPSPSTLRGSPFLPFLLLALFGLTPIGCGLNEGDPGTLTGRVIEVPGSAPVHPARIVLVDPEFAGIVAGPVENDESGVFVIERVPPGRYDLLAFAGSRFVFDRPSPLVDVDPGRTTDCLVRVREHPPLGEHPLLVSGSVRDAKSGDPIAGAFVSTTVYSIAYDCQGFDLPWEAVTDAFGRFTVEAIYNGTSDSPGPIFPVCVSKEGYAVFLSGLLTAPEPPDSVILLDVRLGRARHSAVLAGTLTHRGRPLERVLVGLSGYADLFGAAGALAKEAVPVLGKSIRTDREGRYRFAGLVPGFYTVEPAYDPADGFVSPEPVDLQVSLAEGDSVDLGAVEVLLALRAVSPAPRASLSEIPLRYEWTPHPDANRYVLWRTASFFFMGSVEIETGEPFVEWSPIPVPPHEELAVRWYVDAYRDCTLVGTFETYGTFTVGSTLGTTR